jgi:hypothetical protein
MATQTRRTTPPPPIQASALKGKAGTLTANHNNETLAWAPRPAGGLKVKTHIKAGSIIVHD